MTGVVAETTTYDRIFSTMKAMQAIMAAKGLRDPMKVTAGMLAEAYRLVSESDVFYWLDSSLLFVEIKKCLPEYIYRRSSITCLIVFPITSELARYVYQLQATVGVCLRYPFHA